MLERVFNGWLIHLILVLQLFTLLLPSTLATQTVTANFNQSGISGRITFTQEAPGSNTTINVSLTGG